MLRAVAGFKRGEDSLHRRQRPPEATGANLGADPVRPRMLGDRDASDGPVARLGASDEVCAAMVRVWPILGEAVMDQEVGDALHRLARQAHAPPDTGDGARLVEDAAQYLPPRRCDLTFGSQALRNI
jgi:hypothetical protein